MDWQLIAVGVIVAAAVAGFVKIVFFPKHRGCSCCGNTDCPARSAGRRSPRGCGACGECPHCRKTSDKKQ